MSEHATFTFGRFNPPTTGHKKLVDAVIAHAKQAKSDHYVYPSHSQDAKKNPLSHSQKVGFMRKVFPKANVVSHEGAKTAIDAMKHLHKQGYKKVTMVVGSDRVEHFHKLLHQYNGKEYHFDHIEVKSAGHRDPDAEGVEGMSASKMRDHAKNNDLKSFAQGVAVKKHAPALFKAVRKGMKLEDYKAVFLVGGPGSGKDILIKTSLSEMELPEVSLERLHRAIVERKNLPELEGNPPVIVNGNAESYEKIVLAKAVLEAVGYETSMIFVYTTDEKSKERNDLRISNNMKTISEDVRQNKYRASTSNMKLFSQMFEQFYLYDNTNEYMNVSESMKVEIAGWLHELQENILAFLQEKKGSCWKGYEAIGMKMKDGRPVPNCVPVKKGEKNVKETMGEAAKASKKKSENGKCDDDCDCSCCDDYSGDNLDDSGDGSDGSVDEGKTINLDGQTLRGKEKVSKEKVPTKKAKITPPPSTFFNANLGAVPSGGIGLTAYKVESDGTMKSFSDFVNEAKYQGREVTLNKPMKGDVKKSKVYVKDPSSGNIRKVEFGDPNMTIKKNIPARRKSFRARHHCDTNPGPKTKARYWSCKKW